MTTPPSLRATAPGEKLYFEDFVPGLSVDIDGPTITEAQIIEFARVYDPQPFHIDPEAARAGPYGGVIASGFMTTAITMRLICDAYLLRSAGLASPGLESLKWLRPIRPGDHLRVRMTVESARESRSKPDRGTVLHRWDVFNQNDDIAMTMTGYSIFLKRPDASGA
jgi:acyl dehydratase